MSNGIGANRMSPWRKDRSMRRTKLWSSPGRKASSNYHVDSLRMRTKHINLTTTSLSSSARISWLALATSTWPATSARHLNHTKLSSCLKTHLIQVLCSKVRQRNSQGLTSSSEPLYLVALQSQHQLRQRQPLRLHWALWMKCNHSRSSQLLTKSKISHWL